MEQSTTKGTKASRTVSWDSLPHMHMLLTSEVTGLSPAKLYSLASAGRLKLFTLEGRTFAETASVKALIASRKDWTPSGRGAAARAKRAEAARAALR